MEEEETDSLAALGDDYDAGCNDLSIVMEESYVDFSPCMSGVHIVPRSLCRPTVKVNGATSRTLREEEEEETDSLAALDPADY